MDENWSYRNIRGKNKKSSGLYVKFFTNASQMNQVKTLEEIQINHTKNM